MKQIGINLLLMLIAFIIQSCIFPLLPFLSAVPNLLLILTFSLSFMYGKEAGMLYGFFVGILLDLFYSGPFGFYTLLYINLGYFNGFFTKDYYADYITLPLFLSIVNELAYNVYIYVLRFFIRGKFDIVYYTREIILPEVIFTVVTTLLIYRFFLFTNKRLEEMGKRRG